MTNMELPDLSLSRWQGTRDTLHGYCRLLGAIRHSSSPRQRHWAHVTLRVVPEGFITTPMPYRGGTFGLRLDLIHHRLRILTSGGQSLELPVEGQSLSRFHSEVMTALKALEVQLEVEPDRFSDTSPGEWDREAIDALIESKEYDAARITIGPLLEVYSDEPEIHRRMGDVLVALGTHPPMPESSCTGSSTTS